MIKYVVKVEAGEGKTMPMGWREKEFSFADFELAAHAYAAWVMEPQIARAGIWYRGVLLGEQLASFVRRSAL